jgi:Lipocalin-like domain
LKELKKSNTFGPTPTPKQPLMKKKLFSLIFIVVASLHFIPTSAQAKPDKTIAKKLVGFWTLEKMEIRIEEANATEEEKGMQQVMESGLFTEAFDSLRGSVQYLFNKKGTYQMTNKKDGGSKENGKWKLEGNKLIITSSTGEIKPGNADPIISFEENMLVMSAKASEGMSMVLKFKR